MKTTVIGAYPKISDERQDLRRALHRSDRGEIDEAALDGVLDQTTRWAMDEMTEVGVDVVNDGQIRWDDLLAPLASAWRGCERGPLERFYDNNTYFRQPIISGPLETDGRTLAGRFADAKALAKHELKAAVCGPLTFATLVAEDRHYRGLEERTAAVTEALHAELRGLREAGAPLVDVEEPALAAHPELIGLARRAYERLADAGVALALQPYFFAADPVLDELATFPVAQIGLDLRSRPTRALERLGALRDKTVVLGIVDARNTALETPRELAGLIERAIAQLPYDRIWLAPTTGLEYLPHDVAVRKLSALVSAARATKGVPA